MQLSQEGFRLVRSFEGFHKRLEDGRCIAYRCPAGVLTIGFGVTGGVTEGLIWTQAQAEDALRREISTHEAAVTRLVTAEINQNQFDALVSLSYNIGSGALSKSRLLKCVNAGQGTDAAKAFHSWNKGGGRVLPGLVSRRAREASLFLKPMTAPDVPSMPQSVGKSMELPSRKAVAGAAGAVTVLPNIPAPPDLTQWVAWKGAGETLSGLGTWAASRPLLTVGLVTWVLALTLWNRLPWGRTA